MLSRIARVSLYNAYRGTFVFNRIRVRLMIRRFDSRRVWQYSLVKIDHEIFPTVILSLPLIPEGQLSVSTERMCTRTI